MKILTYFYKIPMQYQCSLLLHKCVHLQFATQFMSSVNLQNWHTIFLFHLLKWKLKKHGCMDARWQSLCNLTLYCKCEKWKQYLNLQYIPDSVSKILLHLFKSTWCGLDFYFQFQSCVANFDWIFVIFSSSGAIDGWICDREAWCESWMGISQQPKALRVSMYNSSRIADNIHLINICMLQ